MNFPGTRLGRLARAKTQKQKLEQCDRYFPGEIPEYFFDRNWFCFNSILDVYRTGTLHLTTGKITKTEKNSESNATLGEITNLCSPIFYCLLI